MRTRAGRLAVVLAALVAVVATAGQASTHKLAAAKLVGVEHSPRSLQAHQRATEILVLRRTAQHKIVTRPSVALVNAAQKAAAPTETTPAPAAAPAPTTTTTTSPAPVPDASVRFIWPAQGSITTPFIPSGPSRHDGIDIGDLRSLTVIAAHSGEVIHVGYTVGFEGYGNIVDIAFASGYQTIYAHLSAMNVQIGQQVSAGQVIGTAGCTGRCYGTHVHFEVRENGTPVNPLDFLP